MENKIGRREFITKSAKIGLSVTVGGSLLGDVVSASPPVATAGGGMDIAVVKGADYLKSTAKAVELLGGMKKFIPKDSRCRITFMARILFICRQPNVISTRRRPAQ